MRACRAGDRLRYRHEHLVEQLLAHRRLFFVSLLLTFASMGVYLLLPPWASRLIEVVLPARDVWAAGQHILVGLGIYVVASALTFWRASVTSVLVNKIIVEERLRVFRHLMSISPGQVRSSKTDNLIANVSYDIQMYQGALSNIVSNLIPSLILALSFTLAMAWSSPILFGCVLLLIAPLVQVTLYFSRFVYSISHRSQDALACILRKFHEAAAGAREIKSFGQEKLVTEKFEEANDQSLQILVKRDKFEALHPIAIGSTAAIGIAILLLLSVFLIDKELIALGDLTAFIVCVLLAYGPAQQASFSATRLAQYRVVMERLAKVMDIPPEESGTPAPSEIKISGDIEFEDLGFAYGTDKPLFRAFNLKIPAGQTVALVGPSGAGKSTFLDLIPRFLQPQSGRILVDGVDVAIYSLAQLRRQVGIVSQEPFLFEGTLAENLRFGAQDATFEEIVTAARAAQVDEFAQRLPGRYDFRVEFNGRNLSVGQRQRIALARMLLKQPAILLLDEPTSALDAKSEQLVRDAVAAAAEGRTAIIVAHRLSTVRNVDRILVMVNGEIAEDGTHEELYRAGPVYRALYDAQFGDEIEETAS